MERIKELERQVEKERREKYRLERYTVDLGKEILSDLLRASELKVRIEEKERELRDVIDEAMVWGTDKMTIKMCNYELYFFIPG